MTDELTAHVRGILDRGGIVMTPQGPLGPADVERLALSGMTREQAIKTVYGGDHENDNRHEQTTTPLRHSPLP